MRETYIVFVNDWRERPSSLTCPAMEENRDALSGQLNDPFLVPFSSLAIWNESGAISWQF